MSIRTVSIPRRDIIAIGGSAGALDAICDILAALPRDLPATILVVMHRPVLVSSSLPQIISRRTGWDVLVAADAEPLRSATCIVGLPDQHLQLGSDLRIHLLPDGFYRGHNIDALFCSLAQHVGRRTIAIIVSGMRKDGAMGLKAIKDAGGAVLLQSPADADFPEMPQNALKYDGPVDFVGPVDALADEICRLVYPDTVLSDLPDVAYATPGQRPL